MAIRGRDMGARTQALARTLAAAVTLASAIASPVAAERAPPAGDPALADWRRLLDALPAALVGPLAPDAAFVEFGDLDAARSLSESTTDGVEIVGRAWPPGRLVTAMNPLGEDWRRATGFTPSEVAQIVSVETPFDALHVFRLHPGAGEAVGPALREAGFVADTRSGSTIWSVGPAHATASAGGPWPVPIRIEGDLVGVATDRARLLLFASASAMPASADVGIAALLKGLSGLEAGRLVRASVFTRAPLVGLPQDPYAAATGQTRPGGAELWRAVASADFSTGSESTAVLALALALPVREPEAVAAQIVAATLVRWVSARGAKPAEGTYEERVGDIPKIDMVPVDGDFWVLRLALTGPTQRHTAGFDFNPGFVFFNRALRLGDVGFLPGSR